MYDVRRTIYDLEFYDALYVMYNPRSVKV